MCTVSFYSQAGKVIITSNRDENVLRPSAKMPEKTTLGQRNYYFPVDAQGGGSWFCVDGAGNTMVLLNGAETKHTPEPPYRKSRGLILLDLMQKNDKKLGWSAIDLSNIEPFTVVAFTEQKLFQLRWNGQSKSMLQLDESKPHIWSSATLYPKEIVALRENWFASFLKRHENHLNETDLIDFHTSTEKNDAQNGLTINRNNQMMTKNITQCTIDKGHFKLVHFDFLENLKSEHFVEIIPHETLDS